MRFFRSAVLSLYYLSRPAAAFTSHSSFSELTSKYDAFILDQFGVMHNGVEALDGAISLVSHLYDSGKKLIILSNTSAPSKAALKRLPKLGFNSDHFVGAVTSGEESSRFIKETHGSDESKPTKALFLTWDMFKPNNPRLTASPSAFLEKCGNIEVAESVDDADIILLHGSEVWCRGDSKERVSSLGFVEEGGFEIVDPLLQECRERDLPLVCSNPDNIVRTPTGGSAYMPGLIAQRYRELGGDCRVFGKPDVEHFEACIRKLGLDKSRVAHVGDSLHHDIIGASAADIPNIFVTSGIHANDLGTEFGEQADDDKLQSLMEQEGSIIPTHVVPAFRL